MENEDLLEARMPKLILQPLVENAVAWSGEQDGEPYIFRWKTAKHAVPARQGRRIGISEEQVEQLNEEFAHVARTPSAANAAALRCAMLIAVYG